MVFKLSYGVDGELHITVTKSKVASGKIAQFEVSYTLSTTDVNMTEEQVLIQTASDILTRLKKVKG